MSVDLGDLETVLSPEDARRVRVSARIWAQIGELCGTAHLSDFLELHESALVLENERLGAALLDAYDRGYQSASAFEAQLHRYDYDRGLARGVRLVCAHVGAAVPEWVEEIERRADEHMAALRAVVCAPATNAPESDGTVH